MNNSGVFGQAARKLVWLAVVTAFLQPVFGARLVEETFPMLRTRTGTYTNVTVTSKGENYIFISHTNGIASVKVADLAFDLRKQLGYVVPEPTPPPNDVTARARQVSQSLQPLEKSFREQWKVNGPPIELNSQTMLVFLIATVLLYLLYCYCCHLICQKTGSPGGFLVWVPVFQMIPLLRAAGMSGWWFLGCFVPVLNIVVPVLWSLNIAKARGKSVLVGILLILPITNVFAFLYLAFSNSGPPEIPAQGKFQTRSLQAAS